MNTDSQTLVPYRRKPPAEIAVSAPADLAALDERASLYDEASRAPSTRHKYGQCRLAFAAWCEAHGESPFPTAPETVRRYVTSLADRGIKPRSITVACSAIRAAHFDAGIFDPTAHPSVRKILSGIRRTLGTDAKKKRALAVAQLRAMCAALPSNAQGTRDRAILLLGFAGTFRRAPLVALDVGDVEIHEAALRVRIRRDKTDQEGRGRWIGVPRGDHLVTCPMRAILAWLDVLAQSDGPLFVRVHSGRRRADGTDPSPAKIGKTRLSAASVAKIVKARALAVGIDPADFAGHSLRSGGATAAAKADKRLDRIMQQTGHVKADTVLGYIRDAEMFDDDNAVNGIGL